MKKLYFYLLLILSCADKTILPSMLSTSKAQTLTTPSADIACLLKQAFTNKEFDLADQILALATKYNIEICPSIFENSIETAVLANDFDLAEQIIFLAKKYSDIDDDIFRNLFSCISSSTNRTFSSALFDFLLRTNRLHEMCQIFDCAKICTDSPHLADFLIFKKKQTISQAQDLTPQEKTILLDFYNQLDIAKFTEPNNLNYLQRLYDHPAAKLPIQILQTYCPFLTLQQSQSCSSAYTQTPTAQLLSNFAHNDPNVRWAYATLVDNKIQAHPPKKPILPFFYTSGYILTLQQSGILEKIKECETQATAQNYETFYHARRWSWNFVNDIFNIIQAAKQNKSKLSKRISLRYRKENCDVQKLLQYREELLAREENQFLTTGTNKTGRLAEITCMNQTIASNSDYEGECTGFYFLENLSIADADAEWQCIKQLFKDHDLADYFAKHEQDIKSLFEMHKQANNFGEILAIKIKKEYVDELAYPAVRDGINALTMHCHSGKTSDLIARQAQLAKTDPTFKDNDGIFYCLAVSDIPGEYGTKYTIESLNMADPVKYQAYLQKRDLLFAQMKEELHPNEVSVQATPLMATPLQALCAIASSFSKKLVF